MSITATGKFTGQDVPPPLDITMIERTELPPVFFQERALMALWRRCTGQQDFLDLVAALGLGEALDSLRARVSCA